MDYLEKFKLKLDEVTASPNDAELSSWIEQRRLDAKHAKVELNHGFVKLVPKISGTIDTSKRHTGTAFPVQQKALDKRASIIASEISKASLNMLGKGSLPLDMRASKPLPSHPVKMRYRCSGKECRAWASRRFNQYLRELARLNAGTFWTSLDGSEAYPLPVCQDCGGKWELKRQR